MSVLIILHSILNKRFKKILLFIPLAAVTAVIVQLMHPFILIGRFDGQFEILRTRLVASDLSFGGQNFTLGNYLKQQISWLQIYYTRILLFLSLIFMIKNLSFKLNIKTSTLFIFLLLGRMDFSVSLSLFLVVLLCSWIV